MKKTMTLALVLAALAIGVIYWLLPRLLPPSADSAATTAFVDTHWAFPLPAQGMPPTEFSAEEASLDAQACGQCHPRQVQDWQTSRHSQTMNAGILWQFYVFSQAESNECMDCHAPLAEQKALVARDIEWPNAPASAPPPHISDDLHYQGLTCAACHVRNHQRFGPEHRDGLSGMEEGLPHGGFDVRAEFSDSRFCAACHQFSEDGPRLNGKLRQDTYNEWRATAFAERGVQCQGCHMPDRRHLWRGISDPQMVRRAMALHLQDNAQQDRIELSIRNVGAGHHFPAYMVPRIDVRLMLVDPQGAVRGEVLHHVIQWRASVDLQQEVFDNRLPAGAVVQLEAPLQRPAEPGWMLALWVDVAPKEHYERMYQDMLRQADKMAPITLELLHFAIEEAAETRYRAIDKRIPLDGPLRLTLEPAPLP